MSCGSPGRNVPRNCELSLLPGRKGGENVPARRRELLGEGPPVGDRLRGPGGRVRAYRAGRVLGVGEHEAHARGRRGPYHVEIRTTAGQAEHHTHWFWGGAVRGLAWWLSVRVVAGWLA
jgi:hypothetical protein